MDILNESSKVNDIVVMNNNFIQELNINEKLLSESGYIADITSACIDNISETLDLSKKMITALEHDLIIEPLEVMFNQLNTKVCEAFQAF